jgi:hypothetical protein
VLAVILSSILTPPSGTPRTTRFDIVLRLVPLAGLTSGACIGTRGGAGSRVRQGGVSILANTLVLVALMLVADRMSGDRVFDPAAMLVFCAPLFLFFGFLGAVAGTFAPRRSPV